MSRKLTFGLGAGFCAGTLFILASLAQGTVIYWTGDLDSTWTTLNGTGPNWDTNWSTDAEDAGFAFDYHMAPQTGDDVIFCSEDVSLNRDTTIGADFNLSSLKFNDASGGPNITISGGGVNKLTLSGNGDYTLSPGAKYGIWVTPAPDNTPSAPTWCSVRPRPGTSLTMPASTPRSAANSSPRRPRT